jgi:hypothetical protein
MTIDFLGSESVLKFIEASKLSKYKIERATNANGSYISVYEFNDSNNNADAVADFKRAAEFINPNIVYKITLYDFVDFEANEEGTLKPKKSKGKTGKQQGLFTLNSSAQVQNTAQHTNNNAGFDIATLRAELINEISKKQEENAILQEIKSLKEKFSKLEEEEEEEEEAEAEGIAGIKPEHLAQLTGLINLFKGGASPAAINGTEEQNDRTENINKAIRTLYKYDKELDKDLLKLADIAENKNETFKMLISTLRSF